MLKYRSKSAGNGTFVSRAGSSETIRNEIAERVKPISVHVPTHQKPLGDVAFGHYLAGLFDGAGTFTAEQELVILLPLSEAPLAYYLKAKLGFGVVYKIVADRAIKFVVSPGAGVEKALCLINGKLRDPVKYKQIINNIMEHAFLTPVGTPASFTLNESADFGNPWLAGFADAAAQFKITLLDHKNFSVRLDLHVSQEKEVLPRLIKG
jgi:hypothetical protein